MYSASLRLFRKASDTGDFPSGKTLTWSVGIVVLAHEVEDDIAHVVVARFTDKADGNADTSQ
mgnify:CR=1 FL=1